MSASIVLSYSQYAYLYFFVARPCLSLSRDHEWREWVEGQGDSDHESLLSLIDTCPR
jgi:hypothetical protein